MNKFNIGDRVIVTKHNNDLYFKTYTNIDLYHCVGTICSVGFDSYGVDFERDIVGHACGGRCEPGFGQYINEDDLDLYNADILFCEKHKGKIKNEGEITMQKEKYEKKPLEQQIKEKYESKRNVLNIRIGFTKEQTLVPKRFYYSIKSDTTIIDFGEEVGKIKTKPIDNDKYNEDVAFNVLAAKAIYKRFGIPFESDMSSLEVKLFAKIILYKNTNIMFDKYVKYLKDMEQIFLEENVKMNEAEQIRKNQKAKNRIRKERQKQRRQSGK